MKPIIASLLIIAALASCKHSAVTSSELKSKDSLTKDIAFKGDSAILPPGTIQIGLEKEDSLKTIIFNRPIGAIQNSDEVDSGYLNLEWKGIFYRQNNYYVKPTKIKLTREKSIEDNVDEDTSKVSGWVFHSSEKDSCFELIAKDKYLVAGKIKPLIQERSLGLIGDKITIKYEGNTFTFYTTGVKKNNIVKISKLYLFANIKGHLYNQLLKILAVEKDLDPNSEDADSVNMIGLFADIDGDKIPDCLLSDYGDFYFDEILFLSKPMNGRGLYKAVAANHSSD